MAKFKLDERVFVPEFNECGIVRRVRPFGNRLRHGVEFLDTPGLILFYRRRELEKK